MAKKTTMGQLGTLPALASDVIARRRQRVLSRGYTLIELMIVVAIIGILATLAVYSVRRYIIAAKNSEPIDMINSIRAAEESYKDETFTYLNVSSSITSLYPSDGVGDKKTQWGGGDGAAKWRELGVAPSAPVGFGYACVAGLGNSSPPTPSTMKIDKDLNYPTNPGVPWYVVRAAADRDENEVFATFVGSSFTSEIYMEDDLE